MDPHLTTHWGDCKLRHMSHSRTPALTVNQITTSISGGLIVSCQALPDEALFGSHIMAKLAVAAERGGARAIRANTPADIAAIKDAVGLPVIGLYKVDVVGYDIYITPNIDSARAVADAGADIIAIDATNRLHPEGSARTFIERITKEIGLPVLADVSTYEEGVSAADAGAAFVSTTMSGYTPYSPQQRDPDVELVRRLSASLAVPVIAEGRIATPEQACAMFDAGAHAVIVGGAITRPQQITERFVRMITEAGKR